MQDDAFAFLLENLPKLKGMKYCNKEWREFKHDVRIHEAGHAVARDVLFGSGTGTARAWDFGDGLPRGLAYIDDGKPLQYNKHEPVDEKLPICDLSVMIIARRVAFSMAGYAAELIASGDIADYGWEPHEWDQDDGWWQIFLSGGDYRNAHETCKTVDGIELPDIAVLSWELALFVLRSNWNRVLEIAESIELEVPTADVRQYFKDLTEDLNATFYSAAPA